MDFQNFTDEQLHAVQERIAKEIRKREIMRSGWKLLTSDLRSLVCGEVPLHKIFNREMYRSKLLDLENGRDMKHIRLDWNSSWEKALEDFRQSKQLKYKTSLYIGTGDVNLAEKGNIERNVGYVLPCVRRFENLVELHFIDFDEACFKTQRMKYSTYSTDYFKKNSLQNWPQMPTLKVLNLKSSLLVMNNWIRFPFPSLETCILEGGFASPTGDTWSDFLKHTSKTLKFLTVTQIWKNSGRPFLLFRWTNQRSA